MAEPYDRVAISDGNGEARELTREEFEALPLSERVRAVLQKKVKFYANGREISVGEALKNH